MGLALKKMCEARKTLERTLDIQERIFGRHHASLSPTLQTLATTYEELNMLEKAAEQLERALDIIELDRGSHVSMTSIFTRLMEIYERSQNQEQLAKVKMRVAGL